MTTGLTAVDGGSYARTAEDIRHQLYTQITAGALRPGERLGAEREMAQAYGVSRSMIRQALDALERSGNVRRLPGRGGGTFVSEPKVERDLSSVVSVPALLRKQGMTAGTRIISTAMVGADEATASALEIRSGDLVFEVVRIRLADGSPISLEHARFPAARFPGLLELPLGGSIYELLGEHFQVSPAVSVERIEVVAATAHEAAILNTGGDAPLLSITRTTADDAGTPIEYSHDLFRADRTRIVIRTPSGADRPAPGTDPRQRIEIVAAPGQARTG